MFKQICVCKQSFETGPEDGGWRLLLACKAAKGEGGVAVGVGVGVIKKADAARVTGYFK